MSTHKGYTAYVLSDKTRAELVKKFGIKYNKFIGHHITREFGDLSDSQLNVEQPKRVSVIGYVDSEDGLEALVCSVDGASRRPDGKLYHITWSLNPESYKPVDSNDLLRKKTFTLKVSIPIDVTPTFISHEGSK